MAIRTANVEWTGDFLSGQGTIAPGSGSFKADYTYNSIAADGPGTNPVELLAASLAACLSSTLAAVLTKAGHTPRSVKTQSTASLEQTNAGYAVTWIKLHTQVDVSGLEESALREYVERVAQECPVGKALAGTELIVSAELCRLA